MGYVPQIRYPDSGSASRRPWRASYSADRRCGRSIRVSLC
jgi:hypothetical protein